MYESVQIFYINLLVLNICGGIVLNSMMLTVLSLHSEIRTPQSTLLKSLCISDLIYLLGGIVVSFMVAAINHVIMNYVTAIFSSFVMALNVYLVAALNIQRYISQKKFGNTEVVDDKEYKYSLWIVLGVWMLALVLAIIECILVNPKDHYWLELLFIGVPMYRIAVYAIVPIVIVIVFGIASSRVAAAQHNVPNGALDREMDSRRISSKLITLCFMTCPIAIFISFIVACNCELLFLRAVLLPIGIILTTFNSFFHPIAMCTANKKLKVLFKNRCCCGRRCCQKPDTSHQLNTMENAAITERGGQTSSTGL